MIKKFLIPFMITCAIIISVLCGIFYIAAQEEIYLGHTCGMVVDDNRGKVWKHSGDHFLYTIE